MVNVYINYEKKFAFVEFRTGGPRHNTRLLVTYMQSSSICNLLCAGNNYKFDVY